MIVGAVDRVVDSGFSRHGYPVYRLRLQQMA